MHRRFFGVLLMVFLVSNHGHLVRADDKDVSAIIDKGIKALGGEDKLRKIDAFMWKTKGKITINGNENDIKSHTTMKGLDHLRTEIEGDFDGNAFRAVTVLSGDKGWRKFGEMVMDLDKDGLANEKRNLYLQVIPVTLIALKGKDYKLEAAGEEKVGDKPAVGIKVMAPDGKDFVLYFDKESGLPVRSIAKVIRFGGDEFELETTFSDYKELEGIKKATKTVSKRNGEKLLEAELIEFKVLDKAPDGTFAEPQ